MMQIVPLADSTGFTLFMSNAAIFGDQWKDIGKWLLAETGLRLHTPGDLPRCRDEFGTRIAGRMHERFQPFVRTGSRLFKLAWVSHNEEWKWAPSTEFVPVITWTADEPDPIASRIRVMVPDKRVLKAVDAYVRPINQTLQVHAIMLGVGTPKWNPLRWNSCELVAKNFRRHVPPHITAVELMEPRAQEHVSYGLGNYQSALVERVSTLAVANTLEAIPYRYIPWLEVID